MNLSVLNASGKASKEIVLPKCVECEYHETLVHEVVLTYQTVGRSGSVAQLNRANVSGGGAKPWRQKGTGRARAGASSSPIWRSGGVTFASTPRTYERKVNRKVYRKAMVIIFAE